MSVEETDIVVIGMGPGGEDAAGRLAEAGLHVTGVEARLVALCPAHGESRNAASSVTSPPPAIWSSKWDSCKPPRLRGSPPRPSCPSWECAGP